jgi:hypothetical protein
MHSSGAQYVALQKYFSHPSLVIYFFFSNATHKTKTGIANRWETTNSNRIKLSRQWTTNVIGFAVPFTSLSILCKTSLLSQTTMF